MSNVLFAFPNFADPGYYSPVLSGGGWTAALPLANLQDPLLSKVARSTDAAKANTRFHADLATARDVRAVVIPAHNLSRVARLRARASTQQAWTGVQLAASASLGDSSITVSCPGGSAMIRAGDTLTLAGDATVYTATSDLAIGRNVAQYSEDFTNGQWRPGSALALTTGHAAPDGSATAALLTENAASAQRDLSLRPPYLYGYGGPALDTNSRITASIFVKRRGTGRNIYARLFAQFLALPDVYFDLDALTASPALDVDYYLGGGVEALPDGWFRCWFTTFPGPLYDIGDLFRYWLTDASGNLTYTGDGTSGVYVWGFQLETGGLTVYKRSGATAASAVTSGAVSVTPALAAGHASGDGLVSLSGEYVSTAPALDTGWDDLFPVVYPPGSLTWGHPSLWDGRITEEDRAAYPTPYLYLNPAPVSARYWLVEVDDTANASGYVELARLFLARGYQPSRNFDYGQGLGWEDPSLVKAALGGAEFYDRRPKRRNLTFTLRNLPKDETYVNLLDMQLKLGTTGQVFVSLNPDETTHLNRVSFLATLKNPQLIEHAAHNLFSAAFDAKEVIA